MAASLRVVHGTDKGVYEGHASSVSPQALVRAWMAF